MQSLSLSMLRLAGGPRQNAVLRALTQGLAMLHRRILTQAKCETHPEVNNLQ